MGKKRLPYVPFSLGRLGREKEIIIAKIV